MQHVFSLAIVSFAAAAGCVRPMPPDPAAVPSERIVVADADGNNIRSINSSGPVSAEVRATPHAAYRALVAVYGELEMAPEVTDESALRVARTSFSVRRTFAGERASAYLDCGQTLTGARADEGRLTLSIASQASSATAGSIVATTLTGVVRTNEGTSTGTTVCTSTGRLEARIHSLVKQRATM